MKRTLSGMLLILALVVPTVPCWAETSTLAIAAPVANNPQTDPSDVVRAFYVQLQDVMKQGDKLGFTGRFKKLQPTIQTSFNLALMTKIAVGTVWARATDAEQQQLVSAFSDFSVANYANEFKNYNGETFTVLQVMPAEAGKIVQTKLTPKDGDPVELNYLVQQDETGAWRIVDVFLNGSISELAARRSEFTSIAKRDGIPALVNSLDEKSKQLGPS
jgi:phospholipid transport system substrate-binding protein